MSKLSKLFNDPKRFFFDALNNRYSRKKTVLALNVSEWKRSYIKRCFPEYHFKYLSIKADLSDIATKIKKSKSHILFLWGAKCQPGLEDYCRKNRIKIIRIEDGFIRSVGLGADHILPYSICLDEKGIYFDATRESDIESLLKNYDFESCPELLKEARECLDLILDNNLTKYNQPDTCRAHEIYGVKSSHRVLVIGQVEDDQSVLYGCDRKISNNDVVRIAAEENPDSQIIYKPHPDVLAGKRALLSNPDDVRDIALIVSESMSLADALTGVDRVYTISSLAGFEALLRGVSVTTIGMPFYAGWGLTDTRQENIRRNRKLTLLELFAGSFLLYAKYFYPDTGEEVTLKDIIKKLILQKKSLSHDGETSSLIESHYGKAKSFYSQACFAESEEYIFKAREIDFWDVKCILLQADIYIELDQYDKAFNLCQSASESKKDWRLWHKLYLIRRKKGEKNIKLLDILNKSIVYAPDNQLRPFRDNIKAMWEFGYNRKKLLFSCMQFLKFKNLTKDDFMLCAAIYADVGMYLRACRCFESARRVDSSIHHQRQYLRLLFCLAEYNKLDFLLAKRIRKIREKIDESNMLFHQLLENSNNSICVVGNGHIVKKEESFKKIDSYDYVVRFNSYSVDYPYSVRYGTKEDIWVKSGYYNEVQRKDNNKNSYVVVSGYNAIAMSQSGVDLVSDFLDSKYVLFIPNRIYEELFLRLGCSPSSGLAFIYWMYKIRGKISRKDIRGFSFGAQPQNRNDHYFYSAHDRDYSVHDWKHEAELLGEITE